MKLTCITAIAATILTLTVLSACSSAPKRPLENYSLRNAASSQLDLGNKAVAQGNLETGQLYIAEAWRLAVSADDPETRVRILLARGNAWFNEGKFEKAETDWNIAQAEAEKSGKANLTALCALYRSRLILARGGSSSAQAVKALIATHEKNLGNDLLAVALAHRIRALADKELGDVPAAEKSLLLAADIHEKQRYLEEAAYDYYVLASVFSKAQRFDQALASLGTALSFDRRAENSNGLGMDWMAIGTVQEKAGNSVQAKLAYNRASEIFRAAFLHTQAEKAEAKLDALLSHNPTQN